MFRPRFHERNSNNPQRKLNDGENDELCAYTKDRCGDHRHRRSEGSGMSVQRAVSDREEALRQQLLTTKQTPHHPVVLVCCCDRCALNTAVRGVEGNFGESKHERARPTVLPTLSILSIHFSPSPEEQAARGRSSHRRELLRAA